MTDFRTQLGHALKRQRQRRKMSQSKLAELANVSDRYLAEIEAGKANVTMKVLDRLATALDWDPLAELSVETQPLSVDAAREFLMKLAELGESLESTIDRLKVLHAHFEGGADADVLHDEEPARGRGSAGKTLLTKRKTAAKVH